MNEIVQIPSDTIRRGLQPLDGEIQAVDPEGRITERLCSGGIPPGERHEGNLRFGDAECVDRHPIGARIRLVRSDRVGAEDVFKYFAQR